MYDFAWVCFRFETERRVYKGLIGIYIRMELLSDNAVVHISAGFEGPFILQVFGVKRDLYRRGTYNFCVTDGEVYIGARYDCPEDIELDNYYLVQLTANFQDRAHPIIVRTLEVVSTALKRLVGRPPFTLQDYFARQVKGPYLQSTPTKKIKADQYSSPPPPHNKLISSLKPAQLQLPKQQPVRKHVINLEGDKRALKLASESQQSSIKEERQGASMVQESKSARQGSPVVDHGKEKFQSDLRKTCDLKDLFERATGWVVLCRVNYLSIVECQNGLFAANFIISDEVGTEMKCVYFVAEVQTARQNLVIGNYYLLTGGEVKFVTKERELQITFDKNSEIVPQPGVFFAPLPGKFKRIDSILQEEHLAIINVIGVIRRIKTREQFKSKTKYTATLCDPIKHIEVDFMLFLNNGEKDITVGMIIVLHNFQVFKQQNIFRLNSTYKSYYFQERPTPQGQDLVSQFHGLITLTDWDNDNYRNISMFAFTHRTVKDLREICQRTDDERIYSSLDLWALDIIKKKSYQACRNCKRPADKKQMGLYECIHCKKIVDTISTHALSVSFADSTGSCSIDVIGQHAENLLGMKASEYNCLLPEEQVSHLECLKFKNVTVRLKSEKRGQKKEVSHSVWGIEKPLPEATIREIKKRMQFNRLKQQQFW